MALPLKLPLDQMQTQWKSQIDPILSNRILQGLLLSNISLKTGDNTINTLIARQQQGWLITDQTAAALIYRSRPLNSSTLTLNASAPCTVSLWVF